MASSGAEHGEFDLLVIVTEFYKGVGLGFRDCF